MRYAVTSKLTKVFYVSPEICWGLGLRMKQVDSLRKVLFNFLDGERAHLDVLDFLLHRERLNELDLVQLEHVYEAGYFLSYSYVRRPLLVEIFFIEVALESEFSHGKVAFLNFALYP